MSENQKRLVFRRQRQRPSRKTHGEGLFCHYMAQIGAIFPPETGLGSKFPWDGSADPWDGNRIPWDGLAERPHGSTKTTLKGGRSRASALTLCQIAHTPRRPAATPPQGPVRARTPHTEGPSTSRASARPAESRRCSWSWCPPRRGRSISNLWLSQPVFWNRNAQITSKTAPLFQKSGSIATFLK